MKKNTDEIKWMISLFFLCLFSIPLSARKTITRHFTGESSLTVCDTFTYRGIPIAMNALIIPPTKEHGMQVQVSFESVEENLTHPNIEGTIMAFPGYGDNFSSLAVGRPTRLQCVEVEKELSCDVPRNGSLETRARYVKIGYGVLARAKVKINWEDMSKSVIKVTLSNTVIDKEKFYDPSNPHTYSTARAEGFDYIQNGKYYKWDAASKTWKKQRRY